MCYSNSVSFIELLRSFYIHGEACAKILCSEKELLNLKDSKLTQNFYGNKTGFVRPGHKVPFVPIQKGLPCLSCQFSLSSNSFLNMQITEAGSHALLHRISWIEIYILLH